MCNAYSMTTNVEAIRDFVRLFEIIGDIGNLPPQTGAYRNMLTPIVRNLDGLRELTKVRWGMPT